MPNSIPGDTRDYEKSIDVIAEALENLEIVYERMFSTRCPTDVYARCVEICKELHIHMQEIIVHGLLEDEENPELTLGPETMEILDYQFPIEFFVDGSGRKIRDK